MKPSRPAPPLFVQRQTYRHRRVRDAVRALPVLGLVLWILPLLWAAGEKTPSGSSALLYLFGVWIGLVALSFWLVNLLRRGERRAAQSAQTQTQTDTEPAP